MGRQATNSPSPGKWKNSISLLVTGSIQTLVQPQLGDRRNFMPDEKHGSVHKQGCARVPRSPRFILKRNDRLANCKSYPNLVSSAATSVSFSHITMDIVGPLERTLTGYRYILVICDYSTWCPEAFTLHKVSACSIAQALLQVFSGMGIAQGSSRTRTTLSCPGL